MGHWLLPIVWFLIKEFLLVCGYIWARATLPRLRYDQLMDLGWKVMIPIALGWFLLLAAIRVGNDNDWNPVLVVLITIGALALGGALLVAAVRHSARQREGVMS